MLSRRSAHRAGWTVRLTLLGSFLTVSGRPAMPQQSVAERLADDLNWPQAQREERFAHMDRIFPVNLVRHASLSGLTHSKPLRIRLSSGEALEALMDRDRLSGVLVLQHGRIRLERYALGAGPRTRWTSFSMTKAVTDALVGYAIRDGFIRSADDPVTRYLPEMAGSAYDGVTVRQLVTMTSGVRWNEDYTSAAADNVQLYRLSVPPSRDQVVEYMRTLPRESAPGTKWVYKTGETDLLGVLLRRATGMSLSAYLQRTLWRDIGAESDATWITNGRGEEFGGSGLSATLRDFGRLGEYVRTHRNGTAGVGWLAEATQSQVAGKGYGYGWWTYPDGSFAALGIFGQSVWVDPARELVVVTLGAWPLATGPALAADRAALWNAAVAAVAPGRQQGPDPSIGIPGLPAHEPPRDGAKRPPVENLVKPY